MTQEQGGYAYVNRNIYLNGPINYDSAQEVVSMIKQINEYDSMVEEEQMNMLSEYVNMGVLAQNSIQGLTPREPIMLEINSGGGMTSAGFSIVSAIENSETPIIGYVTGDCMSMATAIVASCHYRMSTKYASFMIHDVYAGFEGKFNDLNSSVNYVKKIRGDYHSLIVEYTNVDADKLDSIIDGNSDFHFTPEEAKVFGLIDALDTDEVDEEKFFNKLYGAEQESVADKQVNTEEKVEEKFIKTDKPENIVEKIKDNSGQKSTLWNDIVSRFIKG